MEKYREKGLPIAVITMEDGSVIVLELYPDIAPESVKNFIALANSGFYDGLIYHRVIYDFMIQGGDPEGTGGGGPGYSIKGEFAANGVQNDISHVRGVISMARAQPYDSAGSQFFIVHKASTFLDGNYAAFGRVLEGLDVVDAIASVSTDRNDRPRTEQKIRSIRVETFGVDYGEPEQYPDY
ncbi:MAG: peptidylprolyl isomerase [Clostridiales bacterium]|nr:peptidylprolyl isomerase [Clostridiales bacterium]